MYQGSGREALAQRYWKASLAWKGMRDHETLETHEDLINELVELRAITWSVGLRAAIMLGDVVEGVERRHRALPAAIFPFVAHAHNDEPKSMVN